jgi:hypothetical protein
LRLLRLLRCPHHGVLETSAGTSSRARRSSGTRDPGCARRPRCSATATCACLLTKPTLASAPATSSTASTSSAAPASARLGSSLLGGSGRRHSPGCRGVSGFDTAGTAQALAQFRHFQRPFAGQWCVSDCHFSRRCGELEHFDGNVPGSWSQIHAIAAVLIRIGDHPAIALPRCHHGAGNGLIGSPYQATVLPCLGKASACDEKDQELRACSHICVETGKR